MPLKVTEVCMRCCSQAANATAEILLILYSLACAAGEDSWIMRVPKYAARTFLTAVKITSAGVSRPIPVFACRHLLDEPLHWLPYVSQHAACAHKGFFCSICKVAAC